MKLASLSRFLLLCLMAVFCVAPAHACLWDTDTLETELKGLPPVLNVIVGRFERNPDLYYVLRLQRVSAEVKQTPHKLELYDDAGVACDRLKRSDEAMAWMEKKRLVLGELRGQITEKEWREHRYRYLANLGTFLAHRWVREGGNRNKIGEMKRARQLIAQAIRLNPNAHFGREKYQLKVMDWLINPPKFTGDPLPTALGEEFDATDTFNLKTAPEAVKAISGIIVLGAAWQNVDLFHALSRAVQLSGDRNGVAYLAWLRMEELAKTGKCSLLPGTPQGKELLQLLDADSYNPRRRLQNEGQGYSVLYKKLRIQADEWHKQRTAYMMEQLEQGRHPDTDPTFWSHWQEPAPLDITMPPSQEEMMRTAFERGVMLVGGLIICAIIGVFVWRRKKRLGAGG